MFFSTLVTRSWSLNLMHIYNIMLMARWFLWQKQAHCKPNITSICWQDVMVDLCIEVWHLHAQKATSLLYTIPMNNSFEAISSHNHDGTTIPLGTLGAMYQSGILTPFLSMYGANVWLPCLPMYTWKHTKPLSHTRLSKLEWQHHLWWYNHYSK